MAVASLLLFETLADLKIAYPEGYSPSINEGTICTVKQILEGSNSRDYSYVLYQYYRPEAGPYYWNSQVNFKGATFAGYNYTLDQFTSINLDINPSGFLRINSFDSYYTIISQETQNFQWYTGGGNVTNKTREATHALSRGQDYNSYPELEDFDSNYSNLGGEFVDFYNNGYVEIVHYIIDSIDSINKKVYFKNNITTYLNGSDILYFYWNLSPSAITSQKIISPYTLSASAIYNSATKLTEATFNALPTGLLTFWTSIESVWNSQSSPLKERWKDVMTGLCGVFNETIYKNTITASYGHGYGRTGVGFHRPIRVVHWSINTSNVVFGLSAFPKDIFDRSNDPKFYFEFHQEVTFDDVITLPKRDSVPLNPVEGMLYYDSLTKKVRVYDGVSWSNLN